MQLMQPKDPAQRQDNVVLKILPVMIGWFSLNVPAALCIYWFVNNIVTTATTIIIRNSMDLTPSTTGGGAAAASSSTDSTIFAPPPMREKPAGFGSRDSSSSAVDSEGVKTITSNAIDAEIESDSGDDEKEVSSEEETAGEGMASESKPKKVRKVSIGCV